GPRGALLAVTVAFLALVVGSLPSVGHLALGSLEWQYPPQEPATADAVVVLGGGGLPPDSVRPEPEMDASCIRRCLHAAALYHRRPCLLLVSGGKPDPTASGPAWSEVMRDFLVRLGVPGEHLVVEGSSRTTFENAVESAHILRGRHITKIALV